MVLSDHFGLFKRVFTISDLSGHPNAAPSGVEVIVVVRGFSDLKCLDDKEFVVVFGEVGLGEGDAVKGFLVLYHFCFFLKREVVVDWYILDAFREDNTLFGVGRRRCDHFL